MEKTGGSALERFARASGKKLRLFLYRVHYALQSVRRVQAVQFLVLAAGVVGIVVFVLRIDVWSRERAGSSITLGNWTDEFLARADLFDKESGLLVYPEPAGRPQVYDGVGPGRLHGRVGRNGSSASFVLEPALLRMTTEQKSKAHEGYAFNSRMSHALSLDRAVPEFNSAECLGVKYDLSRLPSADVVIIFHNEDLSALLRSVHSVLNRSPPELLKSVVLVNDDSNRVSHPWLFDELYGHLHFLPKTRLVYLTKRRGLMMARMAGSEFGSAEALVYLDSHVECTARWLEPLMAAIAANRTSVLTPFIHTIDSDSLAFESGTVEAVGFNWRLGQVHIAANSTFAPAVSPAMAGGLFAAERKWWLKDLEGYDSEMRLYGGEEMEIALRIWLCGGAIYTLPCSRVGHIFRSDFYWKGQVYPVPWAEIVRNKRRAARAWMGPLARFALASMSVLPDGLEEGSYEAIRRVQNKLACKPFPWYLSEVDRGLLFVPGPESFFATLASQRYCLDSYQKSDPGPGLYPCHHQRGSQTFLFDVNSSTIRHADDGFQGCLSFDRVTTQFKWRKHATDCTSSQRVQFEPIHDDDQQAKTPEVGLLKLDFLEEDSHFCVGRDLNKLASDAEYKNAFTLLTYATECDSPNALWELHRQEED